MYNSCRKRPVGKCFFMSFEAGILCIYLMAVLLSQAVLSMTSTMDLIAAIYLIAFFAVCFSKRILDREKAIHIMNSSLGKLPFYVLFFVPFAMFLIHYIAFYPGGFLPDNIDQYAQATSGLYSDWHPFIQTLFSFTVPLSLTDGWIGSIILVQILAFSITIAYSVSIIQKYTNRKYAILSMLFMVLNPRTGTFAMYPWKDVPFTIGTLLLISFCINIFMTEGKWLNSTLNTLVFVAVIVLTTLFRHNAILFTAPAVFAVIFWIHRKKALFICISIILLVTFVKGPVYSLMKVESPNQRQVETLGLPMTVIGAVVHDCPKELSEEVKKFAYAVAPKEVWKEKYTYGTYNLVKWDERTDNNVIEQYGTLKVISIMIQCIKTAPVVALKGLICLTDPLYSITHLTYGYTYPNITNNEYGITSHGIEWLKGLIDRYKYVGILLPHLFSCLGLIHLVILAAALACLQSDRRKNWKLVLFALPVFCYNFGSMLLLTGSEDAGRFFYYTFLIFPLMLVFYFGQKEKNKCNTILIEREEISAGKSGIEEPNQGVNSASIK